jgi:hypothetical protein
MKFIYLYSGALFIVCNFLNVLFHYLGYNVSVHKLQFPHNIAQNFKV